MTNKIEEMFYCDRIDEDLVSVSVGSVWMVYYDEALVAATSFHDGELRCAMVRREDAVPPIAYNSYNKWFKVAHELVAKVVSDFALEVSDFQQVTPEELQRMTLQWLGDQISSVVGERLIGNGDAA